LPTIDILRIYIWSSIPFFLITATTQNLISENYTKIYLIISIIGAASNILMNIILIPHYGASGAAFATIVSYSLILLSMLLFKNIREDFIK
jgi:PST family polysaccharide transporter